MAEKMLVKVGELVVGERLAAVGTGQSVCHRYYLQKSLLRRVLGSALSHRDNIQLKYYILPDSLVFEKQEFIGWHIQDRCNVKESV